MKLLYTLTIVFFSTTTQAQYYDQQESYFRYGVKAGLNMSNLTGAAFMPDFDLNYAAGAFVIFNMSDKIGLQPEVNFVQSGARFSTNYTGNGEQATGGAMQSVKLQYLEIPMLVNVNLNESKSLKLQAGPSMGILLSQKSGDNKNQDLDIFKKEQFSVVSGLWVQLPVVNFGARYRLGLSNINMYGADDRWHNQAFQVFAGVTL